MSVYFFEIITPQQALGFVAGDTLRFVGAANTNNVTVAFSGSNTLLTFDGQTVTFGPGFQATLFADAANRMVFGSTAGETLTAGHGADLIYGGGGSDTLSGGGGADTLSGSSGGDVFLIGLRDSGLQAMDDIRDFSAGDRLFFANGLAGLDRYTEQTFASFTEARNYASVEVESGRMDVVVTQVGADVHVFVDSNSNNFLTDAVTLRNVSLSMISRTSFTDAQGGEVAPTTPSQPNAGTPLAGSDENDTLSGGPNDDTISGRDGDDVISGGPGSDILSGDGGLDTVTYASATGGVTVALRGPFDGGSGADQGRDTLNGFERIVGSRFNDTFTGTVNAETLRGGEGDDVMFGDGGADLLLGEAGADSLVGSSSVLGGEGDDLLSVVSTDVVGTRIEGGAGADRLNGGAGRDDLRGGDGDDTMAGGGGVDDLRGEAGADLFLFGFDVGSTVTNPDIIRDWDAADRLSFFNGELAGTYEEATAASLAAARTLADARIASGEVNVVSVQVGADVVVFFDERFESGGADGAVVLAGRTLADIGIQNIVARALPPPTAPFPPQPSTLPGVTASINGDMDRLHFADIVDADAEIPTNNGTFFELRAPGMGLTVTGVGFTYDEDDSFVYAITGGTVRSFGYGSGGHGVFFERLNLPAELVFEWVLDDAMTVAFATMLAGADYVSGGRTTDVLHGYGGADFMRGLGGGGDQIFGGSGDDVIYTLAQQGNEQLGAPGGGYLRGEEGNDFLIGADSFDDINGNQGNDTGTGGQGNDWVVGGKDNDLLFGDAGNDLVYGNLGADTCDGGEGDDIVRGGQENDVVRGWNGADYVSGDKGDDTMTGGLGADLFHTFGDAGIDRVTDFDLAQGDRVLLDPGTQYALAQVGQDTVISMTGGGQMILVGTTLTSLTGAWIFGA